MKLDYMNKNISAEDKKLLEELEQKYSPDELAAVIKELSDSSNLSTAVVAIEEGPSLAEVVLDFLKKLEGYRIRLREYHWNAETMSMHTLTDNLMSDLLSIEDEIAEDMQGILGIRITPGQLIPVFTLSTELEPTLKELIKETLTFKASIEDEEQCSGMISILDDLVHKLNKALYLESFK